MLVTKERVIYLILCSFFLLIISDDYTCTLLLTITLTKNLCENERFVRKKQRLLVLLPGALARYKIPLTWNKFE